MPFLRTGAGCPKSKVSNVNYNLEQIIHCIDEAHKKEIKLLVFPELCTTSYTCADLFFNRKLINDSNEALHKIATYCKDLDMFVVIGAPIINNNRLFNCAVNIFHGEILGIIPKSYLPNSNEFYEKRWFTEGLNIRNSYVNLSFQEHIPFGTDLIFSNDNIKIACEICQDLWVPVPPSSYYTLNGANIICNCSASNELMFKNDYRKKLIEIQSSKCQCAYVYSSCGIHESTTDVIFSGSTFIYENGTELACGDRFSSENELIYNDIDIEFLDGIRIENNNSTFLGTEYSMREICFKYNNTSICHLMHTYNPLPFLPDEKNKHEVCADIFMMQCTALMKRLNHINNEKIVLGISGGLDSTLALICACKTMNMMNLPLKNIIAVTMPGFGTTDRTYDNAVSLCKTLGTDLREISIVAASLQHFEDIGHDKSNHDITYENVQARERTQILMDLANKEHALLLGTGDLSEIALGWSTFNGDHMSMYSINCSIPKTLVQYLVNYTAIEDLDFKNCSEVLLDIVGTPISPELLPKNEQGEIDQKTEDLIGPYELHDFFLYHLMTENSTPERLFRISCATFQSKYAEDVIKKWLNKFMYRFVTQQFKRSTIPDGPKVTPVGLSPRGDLKMPSDASYDGWMLE
ncbi:NAD(+) synthase [Hathewaya proteolytica]|uniref:NAD(+) synthase n=1 Tax=Hathewaya proteolytica TaxID=29365 RepID=UPI0009336C98|nr:NAD(+) synthase [Hathewaya proteolytica]